MKKTAMLLCFVLSLTQAFLLPVSASCALLPEDTDGYSAALTNGMETDGEMIERAETSENAETDGEKADGSEFANSAEDASGGYLVGLVDGAEAALPSDADWEIVMPGVIRTDDLNFADALVADGLAEYVEENGAAYLFDGEIAQARDNWVYEATNAAYGEALGLSGEGVRVAVIDSGVDMTNEDLQNAKIEAGYDYLSRLSLPRMFDTLGHGTQVIQMIAADRNDKGGTGIARGVTVVPLRCFSRMGSASVELLSRAIYDAVDRYDCDIINMSWGYDQNSQTLHNAVRHAYESGCILVAAAGNVSRSERQGTLSYPAAYDEVIGVGSVTSAMEVAKTSQQTSAVYVSAPGDEVPVWSSGRESTTSGTSFASPCVTAMLALVKEQAPSLSGEEAQRLLRERAVDRGALGYDTAFGYGTVDVRSLFEESRVTLRQVGNTATLSGWFTHCPFRTGIAALYESSGRMAACVCLPQQPDGSVSFSYTFSHVPEDLSYRLFSLDEDYRPMEGTETDADMSE